MARILLASQDDVLRRYIARRLLRLGHTIVAVRRPGEALGQLMPGAFDLLIAQAAMEGIDGPELARRATAAVPGLRVFFLDGFRVMPLRPGSRAALEEETLEPAFHLGRLEREIDNRLAA